MYEPPVISMARASVRRWLLLEIAAMAGWFFYSAANGDSQGVCIIAAVMFGVPTGFIAWLLLSIFRFAFGPASR